MSEAGYEYDMSLTWNEVALGASGQADILPTMGSIEAARLGIEQDMELSVNSEGLMSQQLGFVVESGGPYDPETAGGEQAAIDKIVEDGARVGIGSLAGGHIPAGRLIIDELYGHDFSDGGDFNVATSDYGTLGTLLGEGKLDVAYTGPTVHTPGLVGEDPEQTAIFWEPSKLVEVGFEMNNLGLGNMISTKTFRRQSRGGYGPRGRLE